MIVDTRMELRGIGDQVVALDDGAAEDDGRVLRGDEGRDREMAKLREMVQTTGPGDCPLACCSGLTTITWGIEAFPPRNLWNLMWTHGLIHC